MPQFVQFPHPGTEHRPSPPTIGTSMGFNTGNHHRKFLSAAGTLVTDGVAHEGRFAFWGEWEAPSLVTEVWPRQAGLPRFLHEPRYSPPTGDKYQNTDPLVLGSPFLYTNCKQLTNKKLRQLTPGSMILFGSGQGQGFVLDTVFVVGGATPRPYELGEVGIVPENPIADAVVFDPLGTTRHAGQPCVAYQGRMLADAPDGPHCWIPCRPLGVDVRFQRPLIEPVGALADLIQPKLRQGSRVLDVSDQQVADAWHHVLAVCQAQGLSQGVYAQPPSIDGPPRRPALARRGTDLAR